MSLELALKENTAALQALLVHYQGQSQPAAPPTDVKAVMSAQKSLAHQVDLHAVPAQPPEQASAAEVIDYARVSAAIVQGVQKNREQVIATLARFGASKGTQLKPEQYAEFLAALA